MTEPFMTAVTVKITLPSNYAENRRGAEVSLSGSFPEGTTCEQAKNGHDALAAEAQRVALSLVNGSVDTTAPVVAPVSSAPAPEKTAASRKPKPSEIVIGHTPNTKVEVVTLTPQSVAQPVTETGTTAPALPSSVPAATAPETATAPAPIVVPLTPVPQPQQLASSPTTEPSERPSATGGPELPTTATPSETPFDGPFVAAPTAEPVAPAIVQPVSVAALQLMPASTGTAGVSVPMDPTSTSSLPGPTPVPAVSSSSSAPKVEGSAPTANPTVPGPVDAASPTVAPTPAGAGGDPLADDGEFKKLIGHHARRLNSLGDAQGAALVNAISAYTNGKGPQAAYVPVELRQALLDKLEAIV